MKPPPLPATVTGQQLAEILGLTARRIDQLADESAVSKTGAKGFELKFNVQGYLNFTANRKSNQWNTGANCGDLANHDPNPVLQEYVGKEGGGLLTGEG